MIACSCDVTITPGPAAATVSPSAGTASASPSPGSAPTLAVITGPAGTLRLAASDGTARATTTYEVAPFRPHRFMSWTSVSLTTLYYLNGGSEVRFLKPDGTTGSATRIAVGAGEQAGFAVDPTDRRIAVAVFAYTPAPADSQGVAQPTYKGMRLYVEDLQGGGHRVDIFSSATVAEFPIGWATGNVILAVSTPFCCQAQTLNPYAASSYHVAKPENGDRLASLCENSSGPSGPIEPVGTMCIEHNDGPTFRHWDGSPFPPPSAVQISVQYLNAISPDGTRAAVGGEPIQIQTHLNDRLPVSGYVFGWLDRDHLVFQRPGAATLSVFDLTSRSSTDLPGAEYLGFFPGWLS